jgi:hypothetical protein
LRPRVDALFTVYVDAAAGGDAWSIVGQQFPCLVAFDLRCNSLNRPMRHVVGDKASQDLKDLLLIAPGIVTVITDLLAGAFDKCRLDDLGETLGRVLLADSLHLPRDAVKCV